MADLKISYVKLPDNNTYEIADVTAREAASIGLKIVVPETGVLPTASADTMGKIYLIPKQGATGTNIYTEYVTINKGTEASPVYAWEQIGDTSADLSNYVTKGTYTSGGAGGHSHTVTGTVTAHKYTKATTGLGASAAQGTVTAPASSAVTGLGTPDTDTFIKSYPGSTNYLDKDSVTPAEAIAAGSRPTKTVLGTATTASKVAKTDGVAASLTYAAADTATFLNSLTVSGSTLTIGTGSAVTSASSISAWTTNTPTAVTATDVSVPVISSNDEVEVAKAGTAVTVATGSVSASGTGSAVLVGLGTASTGSAITGITPATGDFVTSVSVGNPTVTLNTTGTDVTVVNDVTESTESLSLASGATNAVDDHTHSVTFA